MSVFDTIYKLQRCSFIPVTKYIKITLRRFSFSSRTLFSNTVDLRHDTVENLCQNIVKPCRLQNFLKVSSQTWVARDNQILQQTIQKCFMHQLYKEQDFLQLLHHLQYLKYVTCIKIIFYNSTNIDSPSSSKFFQQYQQNFAFIHIF